MSATKERVTIRIRDEMESMLNEVIQMTPATTYTEVIRRALSVYHLLANAQDQGRKLRILTDEPDGTESRTVIHL